MATITVVKDAQGRIVETLRDNGGGTIGIYDGSGSFKGSIVKPLGK
jgi:hypothetical protein